MPENKWPVPEIGDDIPRGTLTLEHPEYTKRKDEWAFFRHSDELTGGYKASTKTYTGIEDVPAIEETYLIPHIRETSVDFPRRVAAARPPRFVKEGIESLTGVLTQQTPNRDNYPDKLADWTNAVTPDGTTLQQWISTELWPKVERYGVCYSYARRPTVGGSNLAEQEKAIRDKGLPEVLLHVIIPENIPWWHEDELGQFEIVHYTEEITNQRMESGYPVENETYTRHWWVTLEGWWYVDDNPVQKGEQALKVEESGFWNTDRKPMQTFPIVPWEVKDRVPPTQAASYAQLAYFRKESELHVVEVNAAFPQTWVPTTAGDEDPEETVKGPHAVAGWDPEGTGGAKPMMLETTGVSLTHFAEKRLPDLESEALAPYGRQREVGGNDSGVALAHIQETAKNLYRQHSKAGGKSEFAAMQPVAELLGVLDQFDESARAAWPRKFGVLADANQSEILTAFWELEPGDGFKKEILSQFAELTMELTGEQLDEALELWESQKQEQEQREQEQEDALFGQDGELRRAQTEKTEAEARAVGMPFAGNPQSSGGPAKER